MIKKPKVEAEVKTVNTFSYKRGEITLNFQLSSKEDMVGFLELLEKAVEDIKLKLK